MNRLFLLMVMLCVVASGHSKRKIDLRDQFRHPKPPIEVYIDEESKELTLDLREGKENVRVVIADLSGNGICNEEISNSTYVLSLPQIEKGEYVLYIFLEDIELQGFFEIK